MHAVNFNNTLNIIVVDEELGVQWKWHESHEAICHRCTGSCELLRFGNIWCRHVCPLWTRTRLDFVSSRNHVPVSEDRVESLL